MGGNYLTREQAAAELGVSLSTIDRERRDGRLDSLFVRGAVRIPRRSIERLCARDEAVGLDDLRRRRPRPRLTAATEMRELFPIEPTDRCSTTRVRGRA